MMSPQAEIPTEYSSWVLYKLDFEEQKQRLRLGTTIVGRHIKNVPPADFPIDSPFVARYHAEITVSEEKPVEIKDLNSQNGTYINNIIHRSSTVLLKDNDIIGFGAAKDNEAMSTRPLYVLRYEPLRCEQAKVVDTIEIIDSDDNDEMQAIKQEFLPPITTIKLGNIIAADNVLSIFGAVDDTIVEGLKKINPAVLEAVRKVSNAETIDLSRDEELTSAQNQYFFEPPKEFCADTENLNDLNQKDYDLVDDELFSQTVMDNIKSDMEDESNIYNNNENYKIDLPAFQTSEQEKTDIPIICLIDSDDDPDLDLNKKVSSWYTKLTMTSQTFPILSHSPEFSSTESTDDHDSDFEQKSMFNQNAIQIHKQKLEPIENKNNMLESPLNNKLSSNDTSRSNRKCSKQVLNNQKKVQNLIPKEQQELREGNELSLSPIKRLKNRKFILRINSSSDESNKEEQINFKGPSSKKPKHKIKKRTSSDALKCVCSEQIRKHNKVEIISPAPMTKRRRFSRIDSISTQTETKNPVNIETRKKILDTTLPSTSEHKTIQNNKALRGKEIKQKKSVYPYAPVSYAQERQIYKQYVRDISDIIRKNAEVARARNAPKKLRFADVDRSFEEHERLKQKRLSLCTSSTNDMATDNFTLSSPTTSISIEVDVSPTAPSLEMLPAITSDSPNNKNLNVQHKKHKANPKKTVRFNDNVEIHYFESIFEHTRKVDKKDIMPYISYLQRRKMILQDFPITDQTENIIMLILDHSNKYYLQNRMSKQNLKPIEELTTIPKTFESFKQYQKIVFALMKSDFFAELEREIRVHSEKKPLYVELKSSYCEKTCLVLETWVQGTAQHQFSQKKSDLVLLQIGEQKIRIFAYMISSHKTIQDAGGKVSGSKIFLKIHPKSIEENYLKSSKKLSIQVALDNLHATIGAYNAVYQLEYSPLKDVILKPAILINKTPDQNVHIGIPKEMLQQNELSNEQTESIEQIFKRTCLNKKETTPNISLVEGPPGTGKSLFVVNASLQIICGMGEKFRDKKILVCAQSNCGIDVIAFKLFQARCTIKEKLHRFKLVRYGVFEKMDTKNHPISLQRMLEFERIKKINIQLKTNFENGDNFKNHLRSLEEEIEALQYSCRSNSRNRDLKKKLESNCQNLEYLKSLFQQILSPEEELYICKHYLSDVNIVCTTLSSCVKLSQYIDYFDICIIDEATQCTEPWTLLPLKFGISSLILVGDSQQLPAMVNSKQAAKHGLSQSLFTRIELCLLDEALKEKTANVNDVIYRLRTQYRMHPEICKFPNEFFYKNSLINAENTLQHITPLIPYAILNITCEQNQNLNQEQITNMEAEFVVELLKVLNTFLPISTYSYGVITPDSQHKKILAEAVDAARLPSITAQTIDCYQGVEKDVIIISNALTSEVGFTANPQRLNVAITRAKKCLLICGNFQNPQSVPPWLHLFEDAKQRGFYFEISAVHIGDIKHRVFKLHLHRK